MVIVTIHYLEYKINATYPHRLRVLCAAYERTTYGNLRHYVRDTGLFLV